MSSSILRHLTFEVAEQLGYHLVMLPDNGKDFDAQVVFQKVDVGDFPPGTITLYSTSGW